MSIDITAHLPKTARAEFRQVDGSRWLSIYFDKDGGSLLADMTFFFPSWVPPGHIEQVARAFNAALSYPDLQLVANAPESASAD